MFDKIDWFSIFFVLYVVSRMSGEFTDEMGRPFDLALAIFMGFLAGSTYAARFVDGFMTDLTKKYEDLRDSVKNNR